MDKNIDYSVFCLSHWTKHDIEKYENFILNLKRDVKAISFEKSILNTKLPCIAVESKNIDKLSHQIALGNYNEFLSFFPWNNHSQTLIIGRIISRIKNFSLFQKYLFKYACLCDNWATCDTLKFRVNNNNQDEFWELATDYLKSNMLFVRRIGVRIMFKFIKESYIEKIFSIISKMKFEKEYYVNMAFAWLICECFIKQKEKTMQFLNEKDMSEFVFNKSISKCCDSLRVNQNDKAILKSLRVSKTNKTHS